VSSLSTTRLLEAHLGLSSHHSGLVSARAFRSTLVTVHRPQQQHWSWHEVTEEPHAAVLFATGEGMDGAPLPVARFVPPHTGENIEWGRSSEVIAVWVPLETLRELIHDAPLRPLTLHPTPMVQAFRAFTLAIARNTEDSTSISRYAIERLLAEMVFGALLEVFAGDLPERGQAPLAERARSTMLLHREDPQFTIAELASELHVSLRHLQRAFAKLGTTPGDALRRLRVELAESLLRNPDYEVLTIEEIAAHSGFTSGLQLRRALRAEGLPSPTRIRPSR
jgi:AraC-like DNA-binding protein